MDKKKEVALVEDGTIRTRVTVELVADEEFFRKWLLGNDPDAVEEDLSYVLVDAFENHLEYKINMADKHLVAYTAYVKKPEDRRTNNGNAPPRPNGTL